MTTASCIRSVIRSTAILLTAFPAMALCEEAPVERVPFEKVPTSEYKVFVKNWDTRKHPVLYALIQKPDQFTQVFGAAATGYGPKNGKKVSYSPDPNFYEKHFLLTVARTMPGSDADSSAVFKVDRLERNGKNLILHYQFIAPKAESTWTMNQWFQIAIPKDNYESLTLIENGATIGTLKLNEDQWFIEPIKK